MKGLKKILALCAIVVLAIAAIFAVPACRYSPEVERIAVEINGGGEVVELTPENASIETIMGEITVIAKLSDDTTQTITYYTVEDFDATKLNVVQTVTIKYAEFSATVSVEVKSAPVVPQITSIEVTFTGEKITMKKTEASEQKLRGLLTVKAVKSDNTKETVSDYEVKGLDLTKANVDQTVTVKYGTFTKTVKVQITEEIIPVKPQIVSIEVSAAGGKVTLPEASATAEAILAKVTVTAKYDDNTTKPVTEGLTVEGFDAAKVNVDQTVTIKYGTFSKTVVVYVTKTVIPVEAKVVSIKANVPGGKITLSEANATAEAILEKITVTATYDDKTTKTVTEGLTVEGFVATKLDVVQTVKIKYGEFSSNISVIVEKSTVVPQINAIEVTVKNGAAKVTLEKANATAEAILAKISVTAKYDDNVTTNPVTEGLTVEGFDAAKVNVDQTVTIKYDNKFTDTVTVCVTEDTPVEYLPLRIP